ncbi:MAG: lipopolysaccharide heptosyltransferase II [Candidatus Gastranaerophilales bacterium]|nr:lipopolysaccharide heptosyltransferase II [Candidatus Gastranaerophilales bacterium]
MNEKIKILIVRLSAIGDVIHSLPILNALKKKFPEANISWVVEDKAADILLNNPLIDKVFIIPKKRWKKEGFSFNNIREFFDIISSIRKEEFDIAIDLQELFKSGIITYLSGAKRRIAHAKTREFADIFINEKLEAHDIFDPNKMIIERYLEPAKYLGASIDEIKFSLPPVNAETKAYIDNLLQNIDKSKPVIVFSPATIWPTKHWIESYWSELLEKLSSDNNIIFIGSENDNALINRITAKINTQNYISIAGKTTLLDLIELFNRTNILVTPDTGPAHIANATEKPIIISIFGATSYKRSSPYGEKHVAFSANLPCQPCFKRKCTKKNPMECMKKITPDKVLETILHKI